MGFEDFTTYVEVDVDGTITVAAQQITVNPLDRDVSSYVYRDRGVGHFGNFVHYIDVKENAGTSALNSVMMGWGLNNAVNNFFASGAGNPAICVMVKKLAANIEIRLQDRGNLNNDTNVGLATNRRYYLKMERTGLTNLTCKIYSDAAHTVLVDTLTIVCQNTTYRYIYGLNSYNTASAGMDFFGWTYNLDLMESHTPVDIAKASDSVSYVASGDCSSSCPVFSIIGNSHTVSLTNPIWGGEQYNLQKDLQSFNFWSGNFSIHDKGINSEPIVLSGIEIASLVCGCGHTCFTNKFINIRTLARNNEEVEISGLGSCVDAIYIIKSFSTKTMRKKDARSWNLVLEYVRDV